MRRGRSWRWCGGGDDGRTAAKGGRPQKAMLCPTERTSFLAQVTGAREIHGIRYNNRRAGTGRTPSGVKHFGGREIQEAIELGAAIFENAVRQNGLDAAILEEQYAG